MKKQLFFLTLAAAAMFSSCTKNESAAGPDSVLATEISAKASSRGNIDTKAPVTGTSLNGLQADVYCSVGPWNITSSTFLDDLYAYGTMTFDDNQYVTFDKGSLGGKNGGSSQLPTNGDELYVAGFYPKGWKAEWYQVLTMLYHTFDGKTDLMATYLKAGDEVKIAYGTSSDKAELIFKHLLTRYNIQVKADNAEAKTAWGSVKSIKVKDLVNNKLMRSVGDTELITNDPAAPAPAFYQLKGTPATPIYSDTQFEAADFAASQALTTTFANACYTMITPVENIDTDKTTAELTLEVVTLDKVGGKETTTEVPLSFDRTKFPADADGLNEGYTRGYSITITLNFRSGAIQAIASVEEWKDGGQLDENVDNTTPAKTKIGDLKDGGIVYWVDPANKKYYNVFSLTEGSSLMWSAKGTYVLGATGQNAADGKKNVAAMQTYSTAHTGDSDNTTKTTGVFATDFPAAAYCEALNTGGATGWYLPAKDEMKAFYDAYTANKSALDAALTANSGVAMMSRYQYWTSTEFESITSNAYMLNLMSATAAKTSSAPSIRCLKSTVPPPAATIGDLKDGGIVYEVTGSNYKVFSLTSGRTLKWSAADTYVLGAGDGQDLTDGKKNMSAIKAYFEANKGTVGSVFSVAFPAAGFCDAMNTGGVTGWYLPAKDELKAFYDAYKANKAVLNAALTANSGTAIIEFDVCWSGTEDSGTSSSAWGVNFTGSGGCTLYNKSNTKVVRCIKAK